MSETIGAGILIALFLMVSVFTFLDLINTWADHAAAGESVNLRLSDTIKNRIDVGSTSETGQSCLVYTAQVQNNGEVTISDFTQVDLLVDYTNTSDSRVVSRLVYLTDWTVSIAPDRRDQNFWNPDEVATFSFTLPSQLKSNEWGTPLLSTPLGVVDSGYFACICRIGDTGFTNATIEAADSGGEGDGLELDPTNALSNGVGFARNVGGDGDRHRLYNYGFSFHSACEIAGIEIRLDWWLDATGSGNSIGVELSWDGGSSWTAAKTDTVESTSEHTAILGSPTDTWGRTWALTNFTNANFRTRITMNGADGRTYFVDWVPVKVHYWPGS